MDLAIVIVTSTIIAVLCFFIGRRCGNKGTSDNPIAIVSEKPDAELERELKSKIDELKTQVADMESRLKEKDEALKSALSEDASTFSSTLQAEIETLKKKVAKLKKDLEDTEDERDDLEDVAKSATNKLKRKTEECTELSMELSDIKRKIETLQREFDMQADELEDEKIQNKERKESIEFVNAILNAKEASDEYTKSRNEAIDNVRNTLWNYYDSLTYWDLEENRENIIDLAIHWANERKKPWLKGKKVIALIGEFSAGKTSIVNRILSQDDASAPKLPTNSKATTAIPTYISYGPVFMSQFLDAGGKLKNIKKEDFERVKKDVLGKVNVSSLLDYFVMSYNNPNLKGITILDTPGFSSNDPEDERRTCEVINEADILFWVFDVNQAINKSSITIIKENIKDVPLFIVMNKCDQLSPNEQNAKENNLRETLKKENISIKGVIRFSEKNPIDVIMKAVESIDCKKDNDEVSQILEDLYGLYDTVNQEYKEWLESLSTQKRNLEITEENIQDYFEQYEEDAKIVGEMPQHESHIFSRDCYEISEEDYYEFRGRCQRMLDNREPFETEITDLNDFSKKVTEREEIVSNIKKHRKMLQDYEKKIIDAVKKFDRNYNIPVHVVSSN
jgi:DNA repair exonuclease SbcCD ATPase subunit